MDKKLPKFVGTINIPGDKSISHRALIIGSQATGIVKVTNLLESADVFSTMNALRKFGVDIIKIDDGIAFNISNHNKFYRRQVFIQKADGQSY